VEEGASIAIVVEARGPRARLRPEVLAGLAGDGPGDAMHGHWIQARYVNLFVTDAGGRVLAEVSEEKVTLAATIPA
jgi:histidine phosphotransferase ChpT